MTPAKRRPATPASKGPTRTAPDVPVVADPPRVPTKEGTELLGPDGAPIDQDAPTRDAGGDPPPRTKRGQVDREKRAAAPSPGRPRGWYPLPVWPD